MKTVNIRIEEKLLEKICGEDGINASIVKTIEDYLRCSAYSLNELKGKFTNGEWIGIAASLNGTMINSTMRYSVDMFIAHCEDAELYENSFSSIEVDFQNFLSKAKTLTAAQVAAVYDRVERFWKNNSKVDIKTWADF